MATYGEDYERSGTFSSIMCCFVVVEIKFDVLVRTLWAENLLQRDFVERLLIGRACSGTSKAPPTLHFGHRSRRRTDHDLDHLDHPDPYLPLCYCAGSICIVQIQLPKHVLDHAACTASTGQHELDHKDQEIYLP